MAGVASIIEASVSGIRNSFDDVTGPRTVISLADIKVLAGSTPSSTEFSQLGGPLPDGGEVTTSELPEFSVGTRYILFFGRRASLYTAVWSQLAFRVGRVGAKSFVLGPAGRAVRAFSATGVRFGETPLIEQPSEQNAKATGSSLISGLTATNPEVSAALDEDQFISNAVQAVLTVGGALGEPATLEAPQERWDLTETTPAISGGVP